MPHLYNKPNQSSNQVHSRKRKRDDSDFSDRERPRHQKRSKYLPHMDDVIMINNRRVELEEYLGRGAYGNVYSGRYGAQKVAVKIFRESAKKYFLNECQCLIRVRHTSHRVINLVGFGAIPNSNEMFMAFEYIGHQDLRSLIRNCPESDISFIKKEEIMLELLYGVSEIHNSGICHHDLKPENILLSDAGLHPIICDFGLASSDNCSFRKHAKGTLLYMPPEAFSDRSVCMSFGADVWSLGVLFYEFITHGSYPYEGKNDSELADRLKNDPPQPFSHRLSKSIPNEWQHVIFDMMLVPDVKQRASIHSIITYLNNHQVSLLSIAASHQKNLNAMREEFCKCEKNLVQSQINYSQESNIAKEKHVKCAEKNWPKRYRDHSRLNDSESTHSRHKRKGTPEESSHMQPRPQAHDYQRDTSHRKHENAHPSDAHSPYQEKQKGSSSSARSSDSEYSTGTHDRVSQDQGQIKENSNDDQSEGSDSIDDLIIRDLIQTSSLKGS